MKTPKTKRMSLYYDKIFNKQNVGIIELSPDANKQFYKVVSKLTNAQKQKVIRFIELGAIYLSTKAKSQIDLKLDNLSQILKKIENSFGKYSIIKNVGQNTKEELKIFYRNIKKYVEIIASNKPSEVRDEKIIEDLITAVYSIRNFSISSYFQPNIAKGNLLLFKIVEYLFKNSFIKKQRDYNIIYSSTGFFKTDRKKLRKLAADFKLTNERVRQLKVNYEKSVLQKLSLISTISDFIIPYVSNSDLFGKSFISVDDNLREKYNKEQKTNFSTYFIAQVIATLISEEYNEIKIGNSMNKFFFVKNELLKYFDFEKYSAYLYKLKTTRNPFDYKLSFNDSIDKYFLIKSKAKQDILKSTAKSLTELFLNTEVDKAGNFKVKANVRPKLYEIIFDILKKQDNPMHISEIYKKLKERIDYKRTAIAVCGIINSRTDLFISFSKTSTFGLREWEKKKADIKGGTIRDIVEEYLLKFDTPKHISEIHKYVNTFRKTSASNILSNFQLETTNRFYLFKGYFVGLQNHSYKFEDFKFNSIPTNLWKLIKPLLQERKAIRIKELNKIFMEKFELQEIQMEYYFEQKINSGDLILKNGFLSLAKNKKN